MIRKWLPKFKCVFFFACEPFSFNNLARSRNRNSNLHWNSILQVILFFEDRILMEIRSLETQNGFSFFWMPIVLNYSHSHFMFLFWVIRKKKIPRHNMSLLSWHSLNTSNWFACARNCRKIEMFIFNARRLNWINYGLSSHSSNYRHLS